MQETTPIEVLRKIFSALDIPMKRDWGNIGDDLDRNYAYEKFFGKGVEEGIQTINDLGGAGIDDIRNMATKPFQFYLIVLAAYVLGKSHSSNVPFAASGFFGLIFERIATRPDDIKPLTGELACLADLIAKRQTQLEAEEEIFGNFQEMADRLRLMSD